MADGFGGRETLVGVELEEIGHQVDCFNRGFGAHLGEGLWWGAVE